MCGDSPGVPRETVPPEAARASRAPEGPYWKWPRATFCTGFSCTSAGEQVLVAGRRWRGAGGRALVDERWWLGVGGKALVVGLGEVPVVHSNVRVAGRLAAPAPGFT